MSKIKINIWILATLLALLTACRDEADDVIQPGILEGKDTLTEQFDIIWSGINQNYVFWEIDPTDWDAVYTQYRPRFEELDKKDTVPTADLQKLYEEVCGTLIDHHMNIRLKNLKPAPGDQTDIVSVHPGAMEVLQREDFFLDIPREGFQVYRDKLKAAGRITNDYEFVNNNPEANFDHLFTYVIDNDILYLRSLRNYVSRNYLRRLIIFTHIRNKQRQHGISQNRKNELLSSTGQPNEFFCFSVRECGRFIYRQHISEPPESKRAFD